MKWMKIGAWGLFARYLFYDADWMFNRCWKLMSTLCYIYIYVNEYGAVPIVNSVDWYIYIVHL